jgi:hypothetical protein
MLQFFHRQASDELNARDVARGLPKSLVCGKWIPNEGGQLFVVDPVLSKIKHSGQEFIKLRGAKWAAFCSEPRDPVIELGKIGATASADETPRMHMQGLAPTIQAAIAEGIRAGVAAALGNGRAPASNTPTALRRQAKSAQAELATEVTG